MSINDGHQRDPKHEKSASEAIAGAIGSAASLLEGENCIYCKKPMNYPADCPEDEKIPVCDPCDHEINAKRDAEEQAKEDRSRALKEKAWANRAGDYAKCDPQWLPAETMRELLAGWDPGLKFGATITGDGQGKSFLLWLLLKKAWRAGRKFEHRVASEVRSEIMSLARHGEQSAAVKVLCQADILAIDDFGLQKSTDASDELWTLVFESRAKRGKPTILCTPYSSGGLLDRFTDRVQGQAILKRLGPDYSWTLDTSTQTLNRPRTR